MKTWLTETFDIQYPIIMAPMFLVSNVEMMIAASRAKIMGCTPALNYRTPELFEKALEEMKEKCEGPVGINLIVNKSNVHMQKQLDICIDKKPDFIITSLGSPKTVIEKCYKAGIKVLCDVVDVEYAKKVEALGADGVIAVNSGAGGHAGNMPASLLIPMLQKSTKLPIISAGGVATGQGLLSILSLGAQGISMGSPFIATHESGVSEEYKDAIVQYGAKDIVMTSKISGTPCTVIKTPYVEKVGVDQNFIESFLNKNKTVKKYAKMLTYYKGMKLLEKAAFSATYKSIWCAGPSIEFISQRESVQDIITRLISEYKEGIEHLNEIDNQKT